MPGYSLTVIVIRALAAATGMYN